MIIAVDLSIPVHLCSYERPGLVKLKYNPKHSRICLQLQLKSPSLRVCGHYDGQWTKFIYLLYGNQVVEYPN